MRCLFNFLTFCFALDSCLDELGRNSCKYNGRLSLLKKEKDSITKSLSIRKTFFTNGAFGNPSNRERISSRLIRLGEKNGTISTGCEASDYPLATTGSIALVMRGDCTFSQKVKMAHLNKAIAVVIVNKLSESGVITALIKDVNFTFTVFTIPNDMGTLLAQKVDEAESSVVVELSTNPKTLNHTKESNDTEFNRPARGEKFQQSFTLEPFSENYTVMTMQNYDFGPSQCPTLDACISQLFLKFQEDMNDMGVFFILKSVLGMVG